MVVRLVLLMVALRDVQKVDSSAAELVELMVDLMVEMKVAVMDDKLADSTVDGTVVKRDVRWVDWTAVLMVWKKVAEMVGLWVV